jgi:hypothetical protein
MLNISYHGGGTVAGVDVVLLDTRVAPDGEERSSRAKIADGSNAIRRWHSFVGHSLGADIPCTGLTVMSRVSIKVGTGNALARYIPFGVLYDSAIL